MDNCVMWTLAADKIVKKYPQVYELQAQNKQQKTVIKHFMQCDCMCKHCDLARKAMTE